MMTIMLYGELGKKFGKVHRYNVSSPREAISALCATVYGFKQALIDGGSYRILRAGKDPIDLKNLADPQSQKESLRIVPVVAGSGGDGDGLMTVVLGAALIWATGGMATAFGGALGGGFITGAAGTFLGKIGFSMLLGGIAQMLFAPPEAAENRTREVVSNRPSFAFDGAINTVSQGNAVPVCYGELIVGSQVISAGLSVEQGTTESTASYNTYEVTESFGPVSPGAYIFTVANASRFISNTYVRRIVDLGGGEYGTETWTNLGSTPPDVDNIGYTVTTGGVYTFPNHTTYPGDFQITYKYRA